MTTPGVSESHVSEFFSAPFGVSDRRCDSADLASNTVFTHPRPKSQSGAPAMSSLRVPSLGEVRGLTAT